MNKQIVSILMFGIFLSPNVLARAPERAAHESSGSGARHVVLYEADADASDRKVAGRDAGEMSLSEHSGKDAQCAFDTNPRHALLERTEGGTSVGRSVRAL